MFVSFGIRMLLSDIWSRSNFCDGVTAHFEPRVLMSAKQSIVYWGRTHPFTDWISHFCCPLKCWLHLLDLIWPCLSDSGDICGSTEMAFQNVPGISERLGVGSLPINCEMKELCQLCGTRDRLLEIKHTVSVGFTALLRCYMFMLKKFTFSLSNWNTELPTSLDVFLSLFHSLRVFSLCLDEVPPRRWTKFPPSDVVEIPPNHIHQKKKIFLHIHDINMGGCVVYKASLRLVEGVYKPHRACFGWAIQCDTIVSRSVHVNQTYLFG